MNSSAEPILAIEGLCKHYRPTKVRGVEDVSISILPGETLALVGESGSGKTTVARAIVRLVEPDSGRAWWRPRDSSSRLDVFELRGARLRAFRREVQIVFQDPWSSLNPRQTAGAAIGEVLAVHHLYARAERPARVAALLERVGLSPEHAERYPHALSGGQRQRVALARAIAVGPRLLVCDEPLAALDVLVQAQILNLLADLRADLSLSILFVSHDLAVVRHIADRVGVMLHGRIVEEGPAREVLSEPRHPYTRLLLASMPDPFASGRASAVLRSLGDSLHVLETGCAFRDRCPIAEARCVVERPELSSVGATRVACHLAETS